MIGFFMLAYVDFFDYDEIAFIVLGYVLIDHKLICIF